MDNQLSKQPNRGVGMLLREFNEEDPGTELLRFIDGLCFKLLLPPLEEGQVIYIAKFLVKEFKWASMEIIDEAIIKAKAGKLGIDSADYNKLNIDFLGRVLNAYRYKNGANKPVKELSPPINGNTPKEDEDSGEVAYEHIRAIFVSNEGGKHQFPGIMLADWTTCYNYLIDKGWLVEMSLEDKLEFAEVVRADMVEELRERRTDERSIEFRIKMDKTTSKYAVASECIRRLTKAWFLTNIDKL